MAKKQTRRSISVSRETYERLRAYCETNGISMSQFVERRVGDFLGATSGFSDLGPAPRTIARPPDDLDASDTGDDGDSDSRRIADQIFTF